MTSVVVTGASGGNGTAICHGLLDEGYSVIGVDRTPSTINRDNFRSLNIDFEITSDLESLLDIISDVMPSGLVNNAGITLCPSDPGYLDRTMHINSIVPYRLTEAIAIKVIEHQEYTCSVVNILSISSWLGSQGNPAYHMSKSALLGYSRYAAANYGKLGLRTNTITPGYIVTPMTRQSFTDPVRNEYITSRIPLGRWGMPADVANAVTFLIGEKSLYLNGANISVDGGMTIYGI